MSVIIQQRMKSNSLTLVDAKEILEMIEKENSCCVNQMTELLSKKKVLQKCKQDLLQKFSYSDIYSV